MCSRFEEDTDVIIRFVVGNFEDEALQDEEGDTHGDLLRLLANENYDSMASKVGQLLGVAANTPTSTRAWAHQALQLPAWQLHCCKMQDV